VNVFLVPQGNSRPNQAATHALIVLQDPIQYRWHNQYALIARPGSLLRLQELRQIRIARIAHRSPFLSPDQLFAVVAMGTKHIKCGIRQLRINVMNAELVISKAMNK
jgi:hypothetical protein